MKVKSESEVSQSCPTLSDPMDCSLTGSSIHGIFQARVLEGLSTHIFVLGPYSWHRALKTIRISCDENDKDVFCYIHEAILEST